MRTKKEKLKILRAAMEILQEEIESLDVVVVNTQGKKRVGTLFKKYESKVRELHAQGYHTAGIAREVGRNPSTVREWLVQMGLVSNRVSRDSPGYQSKRRTLSGTRMQQTMPRNLYREANKNEK
tara:strand:- start:2650 stop:3021 length:372 start_codon:yes stop_codon:yes gene_type:complete